MDYFAGLLSLEGRAPRSATGAWALLPQSTEAHQTPVDISAPFVNLCFVMRNM